MMGPSPNSLGAVGNDFFAHGAVIHGGAFVFVPDFQVCLSAGWSIVRSPAAEWATVFSFSAGTNNSISISAGFDLSKDLVGGVTQCNG